MSLLLLLQMQPQIKIIEDRETKIIIFSTILISVIILLLVFFIIF